MKRSPHNTPPKLPVRQSVSVGGLACPAIAEKRRRNELNEVLAA